MTSWLCCYYTPVEPQVALNNVVVKAITKIKNNIEKFKVCIESGYKVDLMAILNDIGHIKWILKNANESNKELIVDKHIKSLNELQNALIAYARSLPKSTLELDKTYRRAGKPHTLL